MPYYVRLFKVVFIKIDLFVLYYLCFLSCLARIDDEDPAFVKDHWNKKTKPSEAEEPLRADRWYYKKMDGERDEPEQSGG